MALTLAFSFGLYGLAKKKAGAGAVESLTYETVVLTPIALGYIGYLVWTGSAEFGNNGSGHVVLMILTGVVTAIPLICFGAAATRVSLTTIGLLQYLAPTIQFALGVLLFRGGTALAEQPAGQLVTAARNNLWIDAIYSAMFELPGRHLTRFLVFLDNRGVDGLVNGLAAGVGGGSGRLRRAQTGFVRSYALSMLGGALLVVAAMLAVTLS